MKTPLKARIAFLGGGAYSLPSYRNLLEKLGQDFDITLYFEAKATIEGAHAFRTRPLPAWLRGKRLMQLWFGMSVFIDHIRKPYHFFHAHSVFPSGFFAVIAGCFFKLPVVVSLHSAEATGLPDIRYGDGIRPIRSRLNKWIIKKADKVTALTEFLKAEVQRNFKLEREILVIPRGIDPTIFTFQEKPLGRPLRILNVSYLHPVKDPDMLLHAFSLIVKKMDATLVHIGNDYLQGRVQAKANALGLSDRVRFVGFVANSKLPAWYAQADVLMHTSRYESQAVVVGEALASGVLVCGTHVGLMADLAGKCCLTVPPQDAARLAEAVLKLVNDPEEVKRLRENGRTWTASHDLAWTARRYQKLYHDLLNRADT